MSLEADAELMSAPNSRCIETQYLKITQPLNSNGDAEKTTFSSALDGAASKRLAYQICNKLRRKSVTKLTEEESKSLQWATGVIEEYRKLKQETSASDAQPSGQLKKDGKPKRKRRRGKRHRYNQYLPSATRTNTKKPEDASDSDSINMVSPRKLFKLHSVTGRTSVMGSSCEDLEAKHKVVFAVLDRGIPDGAISTERWQLIKNKVTPIYQNILQRNVGEPLPQYEDKAWSHQRIKLITFSDTISAELYRDAIIEAGEVWPGAKLEILPFNELPTKHQSHTFIPARNSNPKEVLQLLLACNPHLPMDWYIAKVHRCTSIGSRKMVLISSKEMQRLLRKNRGVAYYGFGSIKINSKSGGWYSRYKDRILDTESKHVERAEHFEDDIPVNFYNFEKSSDNNNFSKEYETNTQVNLSVLEQADVSAESVGECHSEGVQKDESKCEDHQHLTTKGGDDITVKKASIHTKKILLRKNLLSTTASYAQEVTTVKLAVIDKNAGITKERWVIVQNWLLDMYWDILLTNPGQPPQCDDLSWHGGYIKIIKCLNERSANLYRQAFSKIEMPWPEAKLEVVKYNDIPEKPLALAWICDKSSDPNEILQTLKSYNPTLPTHDWWIEYVCPKLENGRRNIAIRINDESLEILKKNEGKAFYRSKVIIISQHINDKSVEIANEECNECVSFDNEVKDIQQKADCNLSNTVKSTEVSKEDYDEDVKNLKPSSIDFIKKETGVEDA